MHDLTLKADSVIDLQLHTVYSDGKWTPEGLIDHLKAEQFGLAAITDHDRVDITPMLQRVAADKDFPLLIAVEISTDWHEEPVDVLCFGFDPAHHALAAIADKLLREQQDNIRQTAAAVALQGYPLPDEALHTILVSPAVQQAHLLVDVMKQHGYGTQERSAGRILVDAGLKLVTVDIGEAVEATHQSGGVCLIAHPGRGDGYPVFDEAMFDLLRAEIPIDGFEVYYPDHSPEQIMAYSAYAERHNLLVSAGSDSHKPESPPIRYRAELCRKLLKRLGVEVTD